MVICTNAFLLILTREVIVERYVAEESIEFCSEYVELVKPIGLPQCRHDNIRRGKGRRGYNVVTMT